MMPTFFHVQSHLWIAYLFFFNGLILSAYLQTKSNSFTALLRPIEAQLLSAFFLSISINAVCLLLFDLLGWHFHSMWWVLPIMSAVLLTLTLSSGFSKVLLLWRNVETNLVRVGFYLTVFVVLFYNGGLIDQVSDAWWHLSLANKISIGNTLSPEQGHLNGVSARYYPPLWHANLALANTVSGISLPVFWNSFTAWGAVLKVMAFYLFALSLSHNKSIATMAAVLFFLVPGVGDSYMRVSAWPSHIAYTALFCMFYLAFNILDVQVSNSRRNVGAFLSVVVSLACEIVALVTLSLIVFFSHQLELLWFIVAMLIYCLSLLVHQTMSRRVTCFSEPSQILLDISGMLCLLGVVLLTLWMIVKQLAHEPLNLDLLLSYFLAVIIVMGLFYLEGLRRLRGFWFNQKWAIAVSLTILSCVLLSIDLRHLHSLFVPDLAYGAATIQGYAVATSGVFSNELALPSWKLQLRQGLLYSGVLSIPLSLVLLILRPNRLSVFTAGTAVAVSLFSLSPYLYQWLADAMNYHSPWRIVTLLFHPIILAAVIFQCCLMLRARPEER